MRFGLLGPLVLADEAGAPISVGGVRLRSLLAALLLQANTPVAWETLAEAVWDGAPLPTAAHTLRSHVLRLRRTLGAEADRLVTRDPGYLICVQPGELDALEFEQQCRRAGSALRQGAWAHASDAATRALALWRGEPLLDVPAQVLRDKFVPRLEQLRLQALEDGAEAGLQLGRHERLVPQLRELTVAHRLRERFQTQLMAALAGAGRRAEALEAYQAARRVLVEELGVEPGQELRALHRQILVGTNACPTAKPSADQAPTPSPAGRVPRQLPAAAGHFAGRRTELELLTELADQSEAAGKTGGAVVISAIDGMAGIGKTALAIHAAHRLSQRFPHGQLFIDLHGYTQGHPPREPDQALEAFLRALGVPAQKIPADLDERAAVYRQCLADTRTLIMLDNAIDEAQVRPLLPGHPGCLVLITSRRRLKGLDDARSVSLDLLPLQDAVALLHTVAGPDRAPAHDPLLDEIARQCGRLPLALRIAGALLRHRPAWDLGHLAWLLGDQRQRVQALSDGERDLGAVFDLSYTGLDEQHRLLFRHLGLLPGPDTDAYAAAALLDTDPDTVTPLLEDLVDHNLLIAHAPGRYRLHDLIRAHAAALVGTDPQPVRAIALDRLVHYYAHTAQTSSLAIARHPRPAPGDPAPAHGPALTDPEAARAWLRAERDNLEAAINHARMFDLDGHAVALAAGLAEILLSDGPWSRALEIHRAAAEAAGHRRQPAAHATALTDLGQVRELTGDFTGAAQAQERALEIFREIGNRLGEASALTYLGLVRQLTGDYPAAAQAQAQALEIFRQIGNRLGEASALTYLGLVRQLTGSYPAAAQAQARALEIYREIGHRSGEAWALNHYAAIIAAKGEVSRALALYRQALAMNRELNKPDDEAVALEGLGECHLSGGDAGPAIAELRQALEIFQRLGMAPDTERVRTRLADLTAARTGTHPRGSGISAPG